MSVEIDCIEKADRFDPTTAITHIGGKNADGTRWKITQRNAIDRIKSHMNAFHVASGGRRVKVIVAVSRFGNEYIKTEADDHDPNNLLSLTACSWAS